MTYDCENEHQQCGDNDRNDCDVARVWLFWMSRDIVHFLARIKFGCGRENNKIKIISCRPPPE